MNSRPAQKSRLAIVGAAGHGRVVLDVVIQAGMYDIVGFLDSGRPTGPVHGGMPVLGRPEDVAELATANRITDCLVAIGHNWTRRLCADRIAVLCRELRFPTVVHPSAVVASDVVLGEGTVVMAGAILSPGCVIGRHCIVNSGSQLDHDSQMGDFSSLAPGVVTGGNVVIGAGSAICLGAIVIHGIRIGSDVVLGAGALALSDLPDSCIAYGIPARITGSRKPEDNYL